MLEWLPENISTYGHKIDDILLLIYQIVGVWFIAAQALLFYFLIKYRRSSGAKASHVPGNSFKSLLWISVPVVFVLGFDIAIDLAQAPAWQEIKIDRPENPDQTVRVIAQQFAWDFIYPGKDGVLDTEDDVVSAGELLVPVSKKILVQLESKDVIHSFWVPNLRLKQDIVPGRRIMAWFQAVKTGTYEIACAELCGVAHGNMRSVLVVSDEAEYEAKISALPTLSSQDL